MTDEKDAPAEMPGEEAVARAICASDFDYDETVYDTLSSAQRLNFAINARAVLDLFAPILAEKEREKVDDLGQTEGVIAALEARALAAEAALAGERERIAAKLDAQADALWDRCETKRTDPPSTDEQAHAAQAFALQKAAAAIRAEGE